MGWAGATTPALLALLEAGVGLTFLNRQGQLRGRLSPPTGKNLPLRRCQYRQADDLAFGLRLSRDIVAGKLRNSRTMARRMLRSGTEPPAGQFERLVAALKAADYMAIAANGDAAALTARKSYLMGLEGRGAKAYFSILRRALGERLVFAERSRRPPRDPVNALLSLGYSLLTNNIISALELVGLDPYCGFLHGLSAYGRPALALDLMEEFRPIVVDSVVLTVVNKRMLTSQDFEPARQGEGVYLTRRGLRIFLEQYTHRLNTRVYCPTAGRSLSYQKIFEVQARQVARLVMGEAERYQPFLVK